MKIHISATVKTVKVEKLKKKDVYKRQPIDSANNKCYITTRTKEGEQKENKEISSMRFLIT